MNVRPLVILGAGGNAYDVLDIVEAINAVAPAWEVVGFLDDRRPRGSDYLSRQVIGPLRMVRECGECSFINAIRTDWSYRRIPSILESTRLSPDRFATLIHPAASVSRRAGIGRGVYVNFGVSIGGGAVVGDHAALGPGCVIGHNSVIEDYVTVAPGAIVSGEARLGRCCYIGAGAMIKQCIRIGEFSLIGMGAVVVKDVVERATVVGNPARILRRHGEAQSDPCPSKTRDS
jgi:sugar O-acyltransferase (sialic acid O-acetyltransferase NeuD family)